MSSERERFGIYDSYDLFHITYKLKKYGSFTRLINIRLPVKIIETSIICRLNVKNRAEEKLHATPKNRPATAAKYQR